jgi:hypothetical protein
MLTVATAEADLLLTLAVLLLYTLPVVGVVEAMAELVALELQELAVTAVRIM